MKFYLKNWYFIRRFRLVLGIFIVVQSIVVKNWPFVGAGILFVLMPLFNISCCGTSGCNVETRKTNKNLKDAGTKKVH